MRTPLPFSYPAGSAVLFGEPSPHVLARQRTSVVRRCIRAYACRCQGLLGLRTGSLRRPCHAAKTTQQLPIGRAKASPGATSPARPSRPGCTHAYARPLMRSFPLPPPPRPTPTPTPTHACSSSAASTRPWAILTHACSHTLLAPRSEFTAAEAAKKSKLGDYATIQLG